MKLQILITQYNETEEIISPMLDSLKLQHGIDFQNDFEVIIGNDGSDVKLSEEFLSKYPYKITYESYEHSGLPGCRAHLFDSSSADYVMFCDADDLFFSALGLNTIFSFIDKGFDAFHSEFLEEINRKDLGKTVYHVRKMDSTFVHGKVYRRQYLVDNDIIWHPELKCHEDSCFNVLAQGLTKNLVYCRNPFYLWTWRDDSICRRDPYYIPKTYISMIDSFDMLVDDFLKRNRPKEAAYHANAGVWQTYYHMNRDIWQDMRCVQYRYDTEKRFKEYYLKHKSIIDSISKQDLATVIKSMKNHSTTHGVLIEKFTFDDWMKHIHELT